MLNIRGIDHINMMVKSLEESKLFYEKVFGMKVLEEGISQKSSKPYLIIGIKNIISLCLYEEEIINFENQSISHFGINIKNFDEAIKILQESGVEIHYGGVIQWDHSQSIYISDPSGHEIELSRNFAGGL
ncbi:VOC family protein [Halobacteriovorax sp. HLS]|uniref:VOC family protein n=1 Tax=Halobacteriovorax sp. HLS TaxID=2234000 RepID=UPI000FD915C6|nr:VOC family protein [Halobacteriovorax sp. HLS]